VNKPVFLFLYADWCHFCQQQKPIIDELEQEYADKITFIHVNAKENPQAIYEFGVTGFPAMFLIVDKNKEGFVYQEFYGFTEKEVLKESFDYGWEWGLSESIEESSIQSDQTESGTLSITSQENSSVRRWVPYYEMWMTCYSTRKEAADAAKAKYVKPSWCFVRECCPDEDHPWVTIPGTGCAHWVAHQKNISRHPTCYAGRSLCVEDVCPENQRHDWKCCRKGDIWVTPDGGHCGIVTHVNKDTTGKVISLNIEHCSRKCGEKAVCLKPEQVDYGNCCAMRKLCEDKSARKICRGDTVVTQEYDVCEWVDKSETDCSDGYKCVENRIDECKSTAECKKTDDGNGDGDGDGPWPDPDNDRPDENYDVSTPKITSNITFNPETIPQVAVLFKGFPLSTQKLLADFNEPTVFVAAGFSPYLVNDYPILISPSGGLYDLDSLLSFKSNLEEYVKNFKVSLGFFLMNNHISKNIFPLYCLYIPFC
jgi:thioredoxin 1